MFKKVVSVILTVCMMFSFTTLAFADDEVTISVTRENDRTNTLLVTSVDKDGVYQDVSYKFSKKADDSYSGLSQVVANANQAAVLLPEDFGNYYLYAKSVKDNVEYKQMFGPYNVGNKGFITITSDLPDETKSYDSFSVRYSLSSPYNDATIDLSKSTYCWTTSATSNAGNRVQFPSSVGTINSPVGVKGTYYLHMSVTDSKGYTGYDVVGPVVLNGTAAEVYFSGIRPNVNKQTITINVGVPAPQVDFGSSGYQIVRVGANEGTVWNSLQGSATTVEVSQEGTYNIVVKLKTTDGNTNRYTSEQFSVGPGTNSNGSAKVTYSPDKWTSGNVKATIVVTDSYGNKVTPVTNGIVAKSDTTYEYTISRNGSYVLEWTNSAGGVISTTLQVNWIDTQGPTIKASNDYDELKISLTDVESGIDTSKSIVEAGDDELKISKASDTIFFDDYVVGDVLIKAYDKAGNVTTKAFYVENLPSNWEVDIEYDKINKTKWEAIIDIDDVKNVGYEITTKNGWIANDDGTYSVFFSSNGSKELAVKTSDKKSFNILLRMDKLQDQPVEVKFDYKKLERPTFTLEYDEKEISLNFEESYYRFVGEKKNYMTADEDEYSLRIRDDGEYQIEVTLYDTDGNRYKYESDYIIYGGTNQGVYDKDAYEDGDMIPVNGNGTSSGNKNNNTINNNNTIDNAKKGTSGLKYNTNHFAYLSGYGGGYYGLAKDVTRAEFFALLDRLVIGGSQPHQNRLSDVNSSDWYYQPVMRFVNMGVVHLDGSYLGANSPITRAEVAYTLNQLGINKVNYQAASFSDINGHWASADIVEANRKGLVAGYTDGTFKPNNNITRAECVAMLNRASGRTCAYNGVNVGSVTPSSSEVSTSYWAYNDILEAINNH